MPTLSRNRESQKGISIILIAIALVILGILAATLMHKATKYGYNEYL